MNSADKINELETDDFLMVTNIGDGVGESKGTQTEEKVQKISIYLEQTNQDIASAKNLVDNLMLVVDKMWTAFVAFNVMLLPFVVGISLHHLNMWMGNSFNNFVDTAASVLMCWLFTALPLYVFFLIDMDVLVTESTGDRRTEFKSSQCQTDENDNETVIVG